MTESDQESEQRVENPGLGSRPKLPINRNTREQTFTLTLHVVILVYSTAIISAAVGAYKSCGYTRGNMLSDRCDNRAENMSDSEKRFQIDRFVRDDLTFSRAKLLDLAWNMIVGHGGRIVHGLVFYHVACRAVTWILESSTLSASTTIDLLLWPDSWASLSSLLTSVIFGKQRAKVVLALALLAYGVVHVLLFSVLWGAAAGYQSVTLAAYPMPDGSWVTAETEELRICWSLDPKRLQGTPIADTVILGPKLASFKTPFTGLGEAEIWNHYDMEPSSASDAFRDIHACKTEGF